MNIMDRGRTILFIDNSNVFKNLTKISNDFRIDYKKFHRLLERDGKIWETHFFATEAIDNVSYEDKQMEFYNFLKHSLGYVIHTVQLKVRTIHCQNCKTEWTTYTEKGIDVWLATKLLLLLHHDAFDTAILVSGDGDYLEAVKAVRSMGKRVELVAFKASHSKELVDECNRVIFFEDIAGEIEMVQEPDDYTTHTNSSDNFNETPSIVIPKKTN
jgi:uncharacterized LabA/DUF88 family protein